MLGKRHVLKSSSPWKVSILCPHPLGLESPQCRPEHWLFQSSAISTSLWHHALVPSPYSSQFWISSSVTKFRILKNMILRNNIVIRRYGYEPSRDASFKIWPSALNTEPLCKKQESQVFLVWKQWSWLIFLKNRLQCLTFRRKAVRLIWRGIISSTSRAGRVATISPQRRGV